VDYDPQKKRVTGTPRLPANALPKTATAPRLVESAEAAPAPAKPQAATEVSRPARAMPANGAELKERLTAHDARLAREGVCKAGDLLRHVQEAGDKAGHGKDMATWNAAAIQLAIEQTKAFEGSQRKAREPAARAG
jgi:hypothetical protein